MGNKMKERLVKVSNIRKTFGSGIASVKAVDNISLVIERGEILLIMGPSGSGKTTFLSMLGGLLSPDSGNITLDGVNITQMKSTQLSEVRAHTIGFIFQSFNLLEALTVEDNILFPSSLTKEDTVEVNKRCDRLLNTLGLANRRNALPKILSGGEKQRTAIARALINQPKLILADEPTGNLDSQSGLEVMMLLHDIAREQNVSVLIVTHDPRVEDIADRVLWLEDGRLIDRKAEKHVWVKDPVCGMRVDEWRAVHFVKYNNHRYAFCSKRCLERFESNPEVYIKGSDSPTD
ncbi:ATP-binding cassette domain-containing protein [Kangiella shandongensis]|uniref:ATP-binding cassette domain-containing protein n=1 Tax=Kangiella shandongensis TaxID=2763258 RepID=UPI001CBD9AED|nr:ATP-binding cassette domain-containing protein [Kangiella shandongensis]